MSHSRTTIRGRVRAATLAGLATAFAIGAAGCGDDGVETFESDGYPFTFEHPGDFRLSDDVTIAQTVGSSADETVAIGLDSDNGIIIQRYTLNAPIDEDNLALAKGEFDNLISQVDPDAGTSQEIEIEGFPGLEYDSVDVSTPEDGQSRMIFLFDGDQEFLINCQSTPDQRETVDAACDQALDTLTPTG